MSASPFVGQLPHSSSSMSHSEWILDFGVTRHMSPDSSSFTSVSPSPSIHVITIYDTLIPLAGVGFVVTPHLSLPNVYPIPKLRLNLVNVGQLCDSGDYLVIFFLFLLCTGSAISEADWDRP